MLALTPFHLASQSSKGSDLVRSLQEVHVWRVRSLSASHGPLMTNARTSQLRTSEIPRRDRPTRSSRLVVIRLDEPSPSETVSLLEAIARHYGAAMVNEQQVLSLAPRA